MAQFIEVTIRNKKLMLNTSQVASIYMLENGEASIHFTDGQRKTPQESYEEIKSQLLKS